MKTLTQIIAITILTCSFSSIAKAEQSDVQECRRSNYLYCIDSGSFSVECASTEDARDCEERKCHRFALDACNNN